MTDFAKKEEGGTGAPPHADGVIFAPLAVWRAEGLGWTEKALLIEIRGLCASSDRGCWASGAFLAGRMGVTPKRIVNMVSALRQLGWLTGKLGNDLQLALPENGKILPENGKILPENGTFPEGISTGTGDENPEKRERLSRKTGSPIMGRVHKEYIAPAVAVAEGELGKSLLGSEPLVLDASPVAKKKEGGRRDECFEAMALLVGGRVVEGRVEGLTGSARGRVNKALSEIRAAVPGLTVEDLRAACGGYRQLFPGVSLTPTGLSANWGTVTAARAKRPAGRAPEVGKSAGPPPGWWDAARELYPNLSDAVQWGEYPDLDAEVLGLLENRKKERGAA